MPSPFPPDLFHAFTGPSHFIAFGPLEIAARKNGRDWSIGWRRNPAQDNRVVRADILPDDLDEAAFAWKRFAVNQQTEKLLVQPRFPARPVVIRPAAPYTILPGDKVQFFMGVSLAISLIAQGKDPYVLLYETAWEMSQTWFGDPTDGELCFASRTRAQRNAGDLDISPYRVICPVRMKNTSDEVLQFERFCLRGQHLNLYQGEQHLWSNEIGVTYKGPGEISRVAYHRKAPSYEPSMTLCTKADKIDSGYLGLRSFYNEVVSL